VWEGASPVDADTLELALTRLAVLAGLTFFEIALTSSADGTRVAAVNPYPCLEHFGETAQHEIVAGLVHLLTAESNYPQLGCRDLSRRGVAR